MINPFMGEMKNIRTDGQALVTLLFFMIIAVTVTSAAVVVILSNSQGTSALSQTDSVYYAAESGMENALLRLLRNPGYTGETLTIGDSTVQITIGGTNQIYATSTATVNNFVRKIQVQASYNNNILTVNSWKEIN